MIKTTVENFNYYLIWQDVITTPKCISTINLLNHPQYVVRIFLIKDLNIGR